MKAKLIVLGSSASNPLPRTESNRFRDYLDIKNYQKKFKLDKDELCLSAKRGGKDKRTRSCLALKVKRGVILFDAGPDILYQLKREKIKLDSVKAVFITHNHPDASLGLKYLPKSVKIFSEKNETIKPNQKINFLGVKIFPFRVIHAKNFPSLGYKIKINSRDFVYISDLSSTKGLKKYFQNSDFVFADGSILKRNLKLHLSIINQLKIYKKWKLKKIIFTHIGHNTLPPKNFYPQEKFDSIHNKLLKYLKEIYPKVDIAYDGMIINF